MLPSGVVAGVRGRGARRAVLVPAVVLALVASLLVAGPVPAARAGSAVERVAATTDVVLAAIELSRATFGDGGAAHVVLGRDDEFADSLAGAALAGTAGPILYTTGGRGRALRAETRAELVRVLGPPVSCEVRVQVFLLGGAAAVSSDVEQAVRALRYCVRRIAGATRVETSVQIAEHLAATLGRPREVLLARADDWADAATGGAYAAASRVPVVVTQRGSLHPEVASYLRRRRPGQVTLLGGGAALSAPVEEAVRSVGPARRVAGAARDITAVEIVRRLWGPAASGGGITLVNGYTTNGWAYALAAAVYGAVHTAPVLYTQAASLSAGTTAFLRSHDFVRAVAAGPSSLVSGTALDAAASLGSPLRPAGLIGPTAAFAPVQRPLGVAVGRGGNVFVSHDLVFDSGITRFSAGGRPELTAAFGGITVGQYGALARDPGDGRLWHLLADGRLELVDPVTLARAPVLHLRELGIDASAFYDVATGVVTQLGGVVQPGFSQYNDLAVRVVGNQRVLLVSGISPGGFPFVVRLRLGGDQVLERRVILASSARTGPAQAPGDAMSRGIAVSPQGLVLTTLPLLGTQLTTYDRLFAFAADFVPGLSVPPRLVLPQAFVSSRGMAADANGNFFVTTSAAGIVAPGLIAGTGQSSGGALVILPAALNRIIAVGEVPGSLTMHFRGVDVDRGARRAYVATDRHGVVAFGF